MKNKKTIVFVQNVEFPQQGAIDIFYYAKCLSKYDDIHVKVIVSQIDQDISHKNLEIMALGNISYIQFIRKTFTQIQQWKKSHPIDYIYFFAQHPGSVLLQFLVKYILKIPTVYDVVSGPIGKSITSTIAKWTIKIGVLLANKFVLDHNGLYNKLCLKTKKPFIIIGVGYDDEYFVSDSDANCLNKNDDIVFTYIGTLNKERKLDVLIKAFIKNIEDKKNAKLYFIGSGSGENILKILSSGYINKNIFFLGKKEHNLIPNYINSSDIMISYVPKVDYFEYQPPTKLIEYLACNKPAIATDTIAQQEILEGYDFLVHKDDQQSTYEKISWCIENIETLHNKNYRIIVEKYSRKKLCDKIYYYLFS